MATSGQGLFILPDPLKMSVDVALRLRFTKEDSLR